MAKSLFKKFRFGGKNASHSKRSLSLGRRCQRRLFVESLESRLVLTNSLAGFVYLDGNGNGVRDEGETGVPGALITLSGTATTGDAIARTAITQNNGFYEFTNVPAGTYQLEQNQPAILENGSASTNVPGAVVSGDRLSNLVLTTGNNFTANNFGEAALRPEFVTIEWFFASSFPQDVFFRSQVARGEELAGNVTLAEAIRAGQTELPDNGIPPVNRPPVAVNDSYTVQANNTLTVGAATGVLANDSDPDGDSLTASLVTGPTSGTLTLNANGSFTYTPNTGFTGTDIFTYAASDGLASSTATVTITVTPVNTAPVAVNDSYTATAGVELVVGAATGVLANDTDPEGDPLTAVLVTGPTQGSLTLNSDGSFTYTPNQGFTGTDTFTYSAHDGDLSSSPATVTITVVPANTAPVAVDDSYATDANVQLVVGAATGVLANDTDAEGDPLTAVLVTGPSSGTLTLNANGSFTYTPNAGFSGTDTFTYLAHDGSLSSAPATVTITVNPVNTAPVAVDDEYRVSVDGTLVVDAADGVLANDSDADGDPLTALLGVSPSNGTLTLNADGSFTYVPNAGFQGFDSFTYTAFDGELSSEVATVTIFVTDDPVAVDDEYRVSVGGTLVVEATSGVLVNDLDAGGTLTAELVTPPVHGTLTFNVDGSFTYVPDAEFQGIDSFTYIAIDGDLISAEATVTIFVNDRPVAADDLYETDVDVPLVIDVEAGVLANDSDADGDPLTAVLVTSPAHGTLTLNADGSFSYTPDQGFVGEDSFTYSAHDGFEASVPATVTIIVNPVAVNTAPVAVDDTYRVAIDGVLDVDVAAGVLANDFDADDDELTAVLVAGPSNGTLTLNADGSFTYVPDEGFEGVDSFTYTAFDGELASAEATVTIHVTDNPVALDDTYRVSVDGTLVVETDSGVLVNDIDVGGELTADLVTPPAHGTLTFNADGSFTYVPDAGFQGVDSFTYTAIDGELTSAEATVTIFVNDLPVAVDDFYETDEDEPLVIDVAAGVLVNDFDLDGDPLTAVLIAGPSHGTLAFNADGSFTYTPDQDFFGTDTFTYSAHDGFEASVPATVTIVVQPVSDAPVAVDDTYRVSVDGVLDVDVATGVLANDFDADGDELTAVLVTDVAHGTLTFNADGSFTYVPEAGFQGIDSFTYTAFDGELSSAEATVTIFVNDLPVAVDDSYETDEDVPLVIDAAAGVLANDFDPDDDPLTAVLVSGPSHGTLTLNADGSFTYTPDQDFFGTDTFTYSAHDDFEASVPATVTIVIHPVNDAPVAVDDTYNVSVDGILVVDAESGVLANDFDVDGDLLTATLVTPPIHGTLVFEADGSFTYTPNEGFQGADSFTYTAFDGELTSAEATVTIFVNDVPVAVDDSYETDEDVPLVIDATAGVLANDFDLDGDPLTAVLVTGPSHGTLALNADGSFTYTPDQDFFGTDAFTYAAHDGFQASVPATVTIVIHPVNDAPVAVDDTYTVSVDGLLLVDAASGVLANDFDVDGDELTAVLVTGPSNGAVTLNADGSFSYTPAAGFHGIDSFTYTAFDGELSSAEATVTIFVNDPPVAVDDSYQTDEDEPLVIDALAGVLANDFDLDGDPLTAVLVTGPSHGTVTLNADGSFAYTPDQDFFGTDTFTYSAHDGFQDSVPATVTITVHPVNDAPVAVDDTYTVAVDGHLVVDVESGVLANDFDVDGDPLTATLVTPPNHGTLVFEGDGSFTYTPDEGFHGIDSFTYTAFDGELTSGEATVTIFVNSLPVAVDDEYETDEDEPLVIDVLTGVLANDSDPDGDPLTAVLVTEPTHGTVTLNADGSFTYTPDQDFFGTDTFTYSAHDGFQDSVPATVTIVVHPVNDAPVAVDDTYNVSVDGTLVVDVETGVLANDFDVDGDELTAVLVTDVEHGTLTLNADGSFTYTPEEGFQGIDSFTYTAFDGELSSGEATVTIFVNDVPVAVDDSYETDEDQPLVIDALAGVLANDSDADGDPLTAVLVTDPAHGTLTLNADGSFTYTPDQDFFGTDSFTYSAHDGLQASLPATVTIVVHQVNDAPVAVDDTYNVSVDGTLVVDVEAGVLANDFDADGDELTAVLVTDPVHGTLALNADGSFTYTPDEGFQGIDSFTYTAFDGELSSAEATVTIFVNDAPVAVDDDYTANQNEPLEVDASEGVLANDVDNDGDSLTAVLLTGPEHGTLTLNADGSFTYTPDEDFVGTDSFTYAAHDGIEASNPATVLIVVEAEEAPEELEPEGEWSALVDEVFDDSLDWLHV